MPWETVHDQKDAANAQNRAQDDEIARLRAIRQREYEDWAKMAEHPEKDDDELTPQPPGPRESWPIAFMPEGQDICGNGCVLKRMEKPGIQKLGKPKEGFRIKVAYKAYRIGEDESWDENSFLGFRLGHLYVNRILEAAAWSMVWGESATFICTEVYAKENNATQAKMPDDACFRYEITLISWREPQQRDEVCRYDASSESKVSEVYRLKDEAAKLVPYEIWEIARDIYFDCRYYIEPEGRPDLDFKAPEGREEECKSLLISVYLNDAMCSLKIAKPPHDFRRVDEACCLALELDPKNVKALFRRGVARTHLHEYAKAKVDLFAAARLDPKSKEVRVAIDQLVEAQEAGNQKDAKLAKKSLGNPSKAPAGGGLRPPATVFFDIAIEDIDAGRVVMEMFPEAPLTAENFRCLCTGERGIGGSRKPLHFQGCPFHRVIPGYIVQGGDIVQGTGMGGDSIYGGMFRDERFIHKHDQPGLLSMANGGPNTNSSQFFITLCECPHLDGYNVVFGRVIEGMEVLERMQQVPTDKRNDRPKKRIWVRECGELSASPTSALTEASTGAGENADEAEKSLTSTTAAAPAAERPALEVEQDVSKAEQPDECIMKAAVKADTDGPNLEENEVVEL